MEDDDDETTTDLDLNMEPLGSLTDELEEVYYSNILRGGRNRLDEVSLRPRNRWRRWRPGRTPPEEENRNISLEMIMNPPSSTTTTSSSIGDGGGGGGGGGGLLVGEGSEVPPEEEEEEEEEEDHPRVDSSSSSKAGKRKSLDLIAKALGKEIQVEKESSDDDGMSFYDCNICFEMANDPVLTCCGHLFCWPCLYQWLHVHSTNKDCPVCQGEVKDTSITPIYGRGNDTKEPEKEELGSHIPPRPHARRVESLRQCIHRAVSSSFPIEEMIQRIGRRLEGEGEGEASQPHHTRRRRAHDLFESTNMLARRILHNRGIRREEPTERNSNLEQNVSGPLEEIHDLTRDNVVSSEAEGSEPLPSGGPFLRTRLQRAASLIHLSSDLAERLAESQARYFMGHPMRRNHSRSSPIEDRDSVSSVAAVIQSESPTVDTAAAELDPLLSLSSSDTSRTSYVDSEVSQAPRRRRLN